MIIPNDPSASNNVATFSGQARPDAGDIQILVAAYNGTGVLSNCLVTSTGSGLQVNVAAGTTVVAGTSASVSSTNLTPSAADVTHDRVDLVVVNNLGTPSIVKGTAAAYPCWPAIPASSVVLATVYIPVSASTISNGNITDKRVMLNGAGLISAGTSSGSAAFFSKTVAGTYAYTVPTGVHWVDVVCISGGGGGGGGGAENVSSGAGGGGGAAGRWVRQVVAVTPGASLTVTVGAGGTAGSAGGQGGGSSGNGGDGGDSSLTGTGVNVHSGQARGGFGGASDSTATTVGGKYTYVWGINVTASDVDYSLPGDGGNSVSTSMKITEWGATGGGGGGNGTASFGGSGGGVGGTSSGVSIAGVTGGNSPSTAGQNGGPGFAHPGDGGGGGGGGGGASAGNFGGTGGSGADGAVYIRAIV